MGNKKKPCRLRPKKRRKRKNEDESKEKKSFDAYMQRNFFDVEPEVEFDVTSRLGPYADDILLLGNFSPRQQENSSSSTEKEQGEVLVTEDSETQNHSGTTLNVEENDRKEDSNEPKSSSTSAQEKTKKRGEKSLDNEEVNLTGRRLIDIGHLFDQILKERHGGGLDCSFMNMVLKKEIKAGLHTKWVFKCKMCNMESTISSENDSSNKVDVNHAAVNGAIAAGIGYTQINEWAAAVELPFMAAGTFNSDMDDVRSKVHEVAWSSMYEAAMEEIRHAILIGNVDVDGIPMCAVICDGQWSKRSYKSKYDALSGSASIIGFYTKKVLFIGIRNKYCIICDKAKSTNKPKPDHLCFLNWNKASTGMEADIIAEGFKRSMELYGLKFHRLIGDGDSSVHRRLLILRPYGRNFVIRKVECRNHLLRNLDKKLRNILEKSNAYQGSDVGKLKTKLRNDLTRFRHAVNAASKFRREEKGVLVQEKIDKLKADILNIPFHIFGNHTNCRDYFCTEERKKEIDLTKLLEKSGMLADIMSAMRYLSYFADSLLENLDNNPCEQFNSVINKYIGGKRIFYGARGGYNLRVEAAVTAYNTKEYLRATHKALANGHSPGAVTKKFLARRKANAEANSKRKLAFDENGNEKPKKKKRRTNEPKDPDSNYGHACQVEDISEEILQQKMQEVLDELNGLTEEDLKEIEKKTQEQSQSELWFNERKKRLTASNFGQIISMRNSTSVKNKVFDLLYAPEANSAGIEHGKKFEDTARQQFEMEYQKSVQTCGLFVHKTERYLAASPDGIIKEESALLEIKCPLTAYLIPTCQEALALGKVRYCKSDDTGKLRLKEKTPWWYQVQGQLQVTGMQRCYFAVWARNWLAVDEIVRDDKVWSDIMLPKLQRFYKHALLPEIAHPLYDKRMDKDDIRESPYVEPAPKTKKKANGENKEAENEDHAETQESKRKIAKTKRTNQAKNDEGDKNKDMSKPKRKRGKKVVVNISENNDEQNCQADDITGLAPKRRKRNVEFPKTINKDNSIKDKNRELINNGKIKPKRKILQDVSNSF